jgi:alcohol dehydrogenase YqhD (iron-dependent ADH family)
MATIWRTYTNQEYLFKKQLMQKPLEGIDPEIIRASEEGRMVNGLAEFLQNIVPQTEDKEKEQLEESWKDDILLGIIAKRESLLGRPMTEKELSADDLLEEWERKCKACGIKLFWLS